MTADHCELCAFSEYVWGGGYKNVQQPLQDLQKKLFKFINSKAHFWGLGF